MGWIPPRFVAFVALLSACPAPRPAREETELTPPEPARPVAADAATPRPEASPASGTDRACLPVVAAECGCVYSCGAGRLQEDGSWLVRHPRWGETPIRARIDRFCVGEECTEAFFGEIICGLICAPRPADPTCHFSAEGQCESGRPTEGASDAGDVMEQEAGPARSI